MIVRKHGGTTTAELGEKDTSSTSSTVSDVSSKASYEESAAGTVILTKPERKNFKGRSGQARYEQAMIMYNNQKEMLNSYQKTQVKASLAKDLMSENAPESAGNIVKFQISSNFTDYAVEFISSVVDFRYYENVLANNVTASATIVETGYQSDDSGGAGGKQSTVDGLPIRGGERTDITIEDAYGNELTLEEGLYVNRLRDVDPGTSKDVYYLDFASKEFFANEQTRVVKRYEGNIGDNVEKILKDVLKVEADIEIDNTGAPYNFIGNDKNLFYICTWLASKSIPESGKGGSVILILSNT